MKYLKIKAFTLVELIIVITILAILSAIGFLSFQGYSKNTRDSNRLSTIYSLNEGLGIFQIKSGTVPMPDNLSGTGYFGTGGENLLYVGKVGEGIKQTIGMNKIPLDPLSGDMYAYGISSDKKSYQIAGVLENYISSNFNIITKANADSSLYKANVAGNYRGIIKTSTKIYNIPSLIITFSGSSNQDLTSSNTNYIIDKGENLPYSIGNIKTLNSLTPDQIIKKVTNNSGATITGITIPTISTWKSNSGTINSLGYNIDVVGDLIFGSEYFSKIKGTTSSSGITNTGSINTGSTSNGNKFLMVIGSGDPGLNYEDGILANFSEPSGITVDTFGNIYLADPGSCIIKKFSSNGNLILTMGSGYCGDNTDSYPALLLQEPRGITVDVSGNVYIVDTGNNKIKKYNSDGDWVMTIGDGFTGDNNLNGTDAHLNYPESIAVDAAGNIYIADTINCKVKKFSSTGNWLLDIGDSCLDMGDQIFGNISGVAVDDSGNFYFTDSQNNKIYKYSSSGNLLMTIGSGNTGNNNLNGVNANLSGPTGIYIDNSGNIYIADTDNHRIVKYNSSGNWILNIGSGNPGDNNLGGTGAYIDRPKGVAVDTSGNIYVSDRGNYKIKKYSN